MKNIFTQRKLTSYEAITEAQKIAFAPFIFQAVRAMFNLGILEQLEKSKDAGVTAQEIADAIDVGLYGVETLLESGLSCGVVDLNDAEKFVLSKVGYFLIHDKMTRINMEYNNDICYQGMFYLEDSIKAEKPKGLKVFGDKWETIYEALPHLPQPAQSSWYAFDHFYSDSAYPAALPIIFQDKPKTMLDIGTNIGKFTVLTAKYDADVHITMVDLHDQLQNAIKNVDESGFSDRVTALPMDLLDEQNEFPVNIDIYWLSQFLSCFGKKEIISILKRVADAMGDTSKVCILETCWDRQEHEAAAFSLVNTSLYFTAMASGNSKMYHSSELIECVEAAGLKVDKIHDKLGLSHTLFECRK